MRPLSPGSVTARGADAQSRAATATPPNRYDLSSLGDRLSPTPASRGLAGAHGAEASTRERCGGRLLVLCGLWRRAGA